jgi:hypothetical protein
MCAVYYYLQGNKKLHLKNWNSFYNNYFNCKKELLFE